MSGTTAVAAEARRRVAGDLSAAGVFLLGVSLLLMRPSLLGRPGASVILAATYLLLAGGSLAIPLLRIGERALVRPVVAFGIGVGAILLAGVVAGPRVPVPIAREAFILNPLAALAEEAFFRRFLFDRLTLYGPACAIIATAALFALIHVPLYGLPAVWVDLGAGLLLSWQRWATGRWTTSAATHVLANLLAVMR